MIRKHPLALQCEISVVQDEAQEEQRCQAIAYSTRTRREPSLDCRKDGGNQRDSGEDDKVH
jgi:hypothetical protein